MPNETLPTQQISPLSEAKPDSLDELFSRIDKNLVLGMPDEIKEDDIEKVVDYYRALRVKFVQDQANFIKPGRKALPNSQSSKQSIAEALHNATLDF